MSDPYPRLFSLVRHEDVRPAAKSGDPHSRLARNLNGAVTLDLFPDTACKNPSFNVVHDTRVHFVRPETNLAVNPFFGASVGILGIARQGDGTLEYDSVWGVGALAGFEQSLGGTAKLSAKLEYARGLKNIPPRDIGDQHFEGGGLEALYVTFGSRFAF